MNSRTIDVVTDWETVATPGGYEGLRRLADREFSGAVSAGPAWAFFLNGRIVGVFEGSIEDFEDFDATAYRAADPSLPLLFAMQERGGETRASYYTNDTPLREVDRTLSDGGFTGYVELSENVLSGDYYVVYHGGKSMSAAFVGSSERLLTGEEAFETAADEVGIYEVVDVDVDLVDIPDPEPAAAEGSDADDATGTDADAAAAPDDDGTGSDDPPETAAPGSSADAPADEDPAGPDPASDAEGGVDPAVEADAGTETGDDADSAAETGADPAAEADSGSEAGADVDRRSEADAAVDTVTDVDPESGPVEDPSAADDRGSDVDPETDRAADTGFGRDRAADTREIDPDDSGPTVDADAGTDAESGAPPTGRPGGDGSLGRETSADPVAGDDARTADPTASGVGGSPAAETDAATDRQGTGGPRDGDGALTDEQRWQRARTIPSLDPEGSTGGADGSAERGDDRSDSRERTAQMQRQRRRRRAQRDRASPDGARGSEASASGDRDDVEHLRQRLSEATERIESLEAERDDLRAEREALIEERDGLRSERSDRIDRIEELEAECERLRSEVDRLQSQLDAESGDGAASESMPPDRALSGTNLFVRYDSKGQATLKHAHAGEASQSDVRENLRLDHHTTFETEGVVVDGQPYEEFLRDSTEYAFAQWVVLELLYEIGETGNRSELAGVFDAIPDIDRVEIRGEVGVETDDGVEDRSFDVVFRDRMGDPLFVADINPSRDATTEAMVSSLVENAHTVATEADTVAAGFYVTESFFEPGALETVADRTGGGILSRSNKRSFVKLSRKRGYHLCLVEARDGEFHLNVPEL